MSDIEVGLRLKADNDGLVRGVKKSRDEIEKFGNETEQAGRQASRASSQIDSVERSISSIKTTTLGLGASLAGAFALRDISNYADQATLIENKLRDVSESTEALEVAQKALLQVANETRTEFASSVDLYATLQRNARSLVETDQELVDIVKTVNQSFALSGTEAAAANAAIVQLNQGLASGTLRGDEFNSVAEQAPEILNAVAKYLKVTKGELREMAAEGQITARVVVESLASAADEIDTRFSKATATIEQSLTVAKNNLTAFIGEQDEALGVSESLTAAITTLGNNIETVADILVAASIVVGGRYAGALTSAAIAKGVLIRQALIATPAVTGLSASLGVQASRATASTIATNALALSMRSLNSALLLLGGPAGIAIAAGAALLYYTSKQDDAQVATSEHSEKVATLVSRFKELNKVQRQGEIDKLNVKETQQKEKLLALQKAYSDEQERQAAANRNAAPATNQFSGISQAVSNSNALGSISTEIEALKNDLVETQSLKEKLLSVDDAAKQEERLTAKSRSEGVKRLEDSIAAYEKDTDNYSRQLQVKQQVLAGNLTAEEAAIYESMWRTEDAMNEQYTRLKEQITEFYDSEIQKATGNKELIAQLEQEKADKTLEIKRNQQENERLLQEQFQLDMSQTNQSFWEKMKGHIEQTTNNFDAMWGQTFDRFASGIGDATATALFEQQSFGDAMKSIAKGALQSMISGLVELGVKKLALYAIEEGIQKTGAASSVATAAVTGTALASAYAPAAAFASLASFGANSAPAMTGMTATVGLAESLSILGIAHDGIGRVPASHEGTWLLRKDEMVLNPAQADNFGHMVDAARGMKQGSQGNTTFQATFNIDATNAVPGMEEKIRESVEMAQLQWQAQLREDFSSGGELSQSLSGTMAA